MKSKYYTLIILVISGLLLLPKLALATAIELSYFFEYFFVLFPVIILIETFVFWLLAKKVFKDQIKFSKILLATIIANIFTGWIGVYTTMPELSSSECIPASFMCTYIISPLFGIFIPFIIIVLIEWAIYILFFRKIIKILNLLKISLIANLISIVFIGTLTGNWFGLR